MLTDDDRAIETQAVLVDWANPYSLVCRTKPVRVLVPLACSEAENLGSILRVTEVRTGACGELILRDGLGMGAIAAPPVTSNWERPKGASAWPSEMVTTRCLSAVRIICGDDGWRTSWGG